MLEKGEGVRLYRHCFASGTSSASERSKIQREVKKGEFRRRELTDCFRANRFSPSSPSLGIPQSAPLQSSAGTFRGTLARGAYRSEDSVPQRWGGVDSWRLSTKGRVIDRIPRGPVVPKNARQNRQRNSSCTKLNRPPTMGTRLITDHRSARLRLNVVHVEFVSIHYRLRDLAIPSGFAR